MKTSSSVPRMGEIRYGYVEPSENNLTHKYEGLHPYLVVSNDIYNRYSGQCEVIPFTTKRWDSNSPSHVRYEIGEVEGLERESTLIIESRDTILNSQLGEPIGRFTDGNWQKVTQAMLVQYPFMKCMSAVDETAVS